MEGVARKRCRLTGAPVRRGTPAANLAESRFTLACGGVGGESASSAVVDDSLFAYPSFDAVL